MRSGATPTSNPFRVRRGSRIKLTNKQRALCVCGMTRFEHERGCLRPDHEFKERDEIERVTLKRLGGIGGRRPTGPLRNVIEHRLDGTVLLECGHILHRRTNNDSKRLCPACPYEREGQAQEGK